jgi:hypothetical protein
MDEDEYQNQRMTAEIDKTLAIVSQHVKDDSEQAFQQILPLIQQLLQAMQQLTPQPQLPPEAMVLRETSMAETQRRAQRDQAEMQLKGQDLQQKAQLEMARLQSEQTTSPKSVSKLRDSPNRMSACRQSSMRLLSGFRTKHNAT